MKCGVSSELVARLFIVMDHVDGQPLSVLVNEGMAKTTVMCGAQIADALAHDRGIVNRDQKSTNLMIASDGHVKMLHFGIAALVDDAASLAESHEATSPGMLTGTRAYMAPEVLRRGRANRRSAIGGRPAW